MEKSDELYQFIHQLSGPEKRYFKQEALKNSSGTKPNYLKLFEVYTEMKSYDEEVLKALPYVKYFSESKNHLFEKLLDSCRNFEKKHTHSFRLKEMITDIRFLWKRGLTQKCRKYIRTAKKLARELDDQSSLLEILVEERRLMYNIQDGNLKKDVELTRIHKEMQDAIHALNTLRQYTTLSDGLYLAIARKIDLTNKEEYKKLEATVPLQLIKEPEDELTGNALRFYYFSKGIYGRLSNSPELTFESFQQMAQWWEKYPKLTAEEPNRYISDISNSIMGTFLKKDYALMTKQLKRLKRLSPKTINNQVFRFVSHSTYSLLLALELGDLEEASTLLIGIKRGINKYTIEGRKKLILVINMVEVHFLKEEFEECYKLLRPLTRGNIAKERVDLRSLAHLFQMAILFSLNKLSELEALYRRTRELFSKIGIKEENYEYIILNKINEIQKALPQDRPTLFISLQQFIEQELNNPSRVNPPGLDILNYWTQSIISGTKMSILFSKDKKH